MVYIGDSNESQSLEIHRFTRISYRAKDESGEFKFECTQIDKIEEPILIYEWHTRKMIKTKWLKTEHEIYTNPDRFFNKDGRLIIMDNDSHQPLTET